MAVVPVRLSEDDVRKLNVLMKRGIYKSRNEAIRALVEDGLQVKLGEDDDVTQIVDRLLALRKKEEIPIWFKSRKTAAEMVAEGRK
jgi:Arc/MetJ-type ribon-helix-helix transcriptional regulator